MSYHRILTVQDISCVGQCSMTVALPILSACGHEVCILPSALLSTHTGGFVNPAVYNLKECMDSIWHHWKREGITFNAIYTGYLGSVGAIGTVFKIIDELLAPGGKVIVDPAMADHGKLYRGFDVEYACAMKELCLRSDVMIPNITEAAMMSGLPYLETFDEQYIRSLMDGLGGKDVVLTGVAFNPGMTGAAIRTNGDISFCFHERYDRNFHGTGDIFASAFTGAWMQDKSMEEAVRIASGFTCRSICHTIENPAHPYGVKFESALPDLIKALQ